MGNNISAHLIYCCLNWTNFENGDQNNIKYFGLKYLYSVGIFFKLKLKYKKLYYF